MPAYARIAGCATVLVFEDAGTAANLGEALQYATSKGSVIRFDGGGDAVVINFGAVASIEISSDPARHPGPAEREIRCTLVQLSGSAPTIW